jgi:hypothetical protein
MANNKKGIPNQVNLACNLIWGSFIFSVVRLFNTPTVNNGVPVGEQLLFGLVFMAAFNLWAVSYLKKGRNWMRITYVAILAINLLTKFTFELITTIEYGLCIAAVFFMFSKNTGKFFE